MLPSSPTLTFSPMNQEKSKKRVSVENGANVTSFSHVVEELKECEMSADNVKKS